MATLEKIRNKAGFLIAAVIGLSLLAFILTDFLDSRKSMFFSSKSNMGEINGKSIPVQDFEKKVTEMTDIYKMNSGKTTVDEATSENIREQAWNDIVSEMIYGRELKKLGLAVTPDELFDQVQGSNPHSIVRQLFTNPNTGEFNKPALLQFLKATNEDQPSEQRKFRLFMEREILKDRTSTKYNNLVRKGLNAPGYMAKDAYMASYKKADFLFVQLPYASESDNTIKPTESELKAFYKEHKYLYEQADAARDAEIVSFTITPSKLDFKNADEWINKIKPDFTSATEVEQFVNGNSDVQYVDKNYKVSDVPDSLGAFMFKANIGEVYGPYLLAGTYKLARLYKVVNLPDSVKARHILIQPKGQTKNDVESAKATADSLKTILEKGGDFAALAQRYSTDKGSAAKGGDLGWFKEGTMVKPFNDAAFEGKKNEIKVVESQFGYHIIQVLDRGKDVKKVKVAFIERKVEASNLTFQETYKRALKFAAENRTFDKFQATSEKERLPKYPVSNIRENDKNIQSFTNARPLVKWIYGAKKGDISEPIDLNGRYVVAAVTKVRTKGITPFEDVTSDVEVAVRKDKKAQVLIEKFEKASAGARTIQDLAVKLASPVQTAEGISFSSYSLPAVGMEPELIASAPESKQKISKPIKGENGVYVVYSTRIITPSTENYTEAKMRLNYMLGSALNYSVYGALQKLAKLEDKRSTFY